MKRIFETVRVGITRRKYTRALRAPIQAVLPSGLTWYKDFKGPSYSADYAIGNGAITATASRGANGGSICDQNGFVRASTVDNTLRHTYGFWNSSGFVVAPGMLAEATISNLIPRANDVENAVWTKTDITPTNADAGSANILGDSTTNSLRADADDGTILLASAVTAQTYSVWIKRKAGAGAIYITANGGTNWTEVTVLSTWARFQVTAAGASQTCGIKMGVSGDEIYICGQQFENFIVATSYINTTSTAVTRNGELASGVAANHIFDVSHVVVQLVITSHAASNVGYILDTSAANPRRVMVGNSPPSTYRAYANLSEGGDNANTTTPPTLFQPDVVSAGFNTSSPYVQIWLNGILEGSYTAGSHAAFSPGPNFYLGCRHNGITNLGGIIQKFALFNRVLTDNEVKYVTNMMRSY